LRSSRKEAPGDDRNGNIPTTDERQTEEQSFGFFFIGFGDKKDWCAQTRHAVEGLKLANMSCRQLQKSDPRYCRIAFVGDLASGHAAREQCPQQFDVIAPSDVSKCLDRMKKDARGQKMCVRALGLAPFTHNIFMDSDTVAVSSEIERIFDVLLKGFDLTGAFECCARTWDWKVAEDALFHGWELQTGVLGFKRNANVADHAGKAMDLFIETGRKYTSAEQQAETLALSQSQVRFMPLPPAFNVRGPTTKGYRNMPMALAHFKYNVSQPETTTVIKQAQTWIKNSIKNCKDVDV
jgi:hypothetical protein